MRLNWAGFPSVIQGLVNGELLENDPAPIQRRGSQDFLVGFLQGGCSRRNSPLRCSREVVDLAVSRQAASTGSIRFHQRLRNCSSS